MQEAIFFMRISSYIKKLPFFQLDEGVYPQLCPSVLVLFICLNLYFFNPPKILHSYCEGLIDFVRGGDILWRCENIYTKQCNIFICAEKKKNRQTNRETNTHFRIDCLDKPEGGAYIFCSWSGCLLETSENLSPIVHSFHLCGKINRQTNR